MRLEGEALTDQTNAGIEFDCGSQFGTFQILVSVTFIILLLCTHEEALHIFDKRSNILIFLQQ